MLPQHLICGGDHTLVLVYLFFELEFIKFFLPNHININNILANREISIFTSAFLFKCHKFQKCSKMNNCSISEAIKICGCSLLFYTICLDAYVFEYANCIEKITFLYVISFSQFFKWLLLFVWKGMYVKDFTLFYPCGLD